MALSLFKKSTKTDEELEQEVEKQGGPVDNRPLYERLQESEAKKQQKYEDEHKIRPPPGLSKDEIEFFSQYSQSNKMHHLGIRKQDEEDFLKAKIQLEMEIKQKEQTKKQSLFAAYDTQKKKSEQGKNKKETESAESEKMSNVESIPIQKQKRDSSTPSTSQQEKEERNLQKTTSEPVNALSLLMADYGDDSDED